MGAKGTGLEPLGNCFHFILGPRSQWEATERHWEKFLNSCYGEFPGGLVVRIPGFHCCGSFQSLVRKQILHVIWHDQKKKIFIDI